MNQSILMKPRKKNLQNRVNKLRKMINKVVLAMMIKKVMMIKRRNNKKKRSRKKKSLKYN